MLHSSYLHRFFFFSRFSSETRPTVSVRSDDKRIVGALCKTKKTGARSDVFFSSSSSVKTDAQLCETKGLL